MPNYTIFEVICNFMMNDFEVAIKDMEQARSLGYKRHLVNS